MGRLAKARKARKGKGKEAKGKDKGKEKGKFGGKDGKGAWKGAEKGKSFWDRSWAKKGKPSEKGGKGTKSGACHLCGNSWTLCQRVLEESQPGRGATEPRRSEFIIYREMQGAPLQQPQ